MQPISASDAVFLDAEGPKSPLIIGGLFILDPSTVPGSVVRHSGQWLQVHRPGWPGLNWG